MTAQNALSQNYDQITCSDSAAAASAITSVVQSVAAPSVGLQQTAESAVAKTAITISFGIGQEAISASDYLSQKPLEIADWIDPSLRQSYEDATAQARENLRIQEKIALTGVDLNAAAKQAKDLIGKGKGPVYGTNVHSAFEDLVVSMGNPDLNAERSYLLGRDVGRGSLGSTRVDAVLYDNGNIVAVWDLKTGGAKLTSGRVAEIRMALQIGANVPVMEIHP